MKTYCNYIDVVFFLKVRLYTPTFAPEKEPLFVKDFYILINVIVSLW